MHKAKKNNTKMTETILVPSNANGVVIVSSQNGSASQNGNEKIKEQIVTVMQNKSIPEKQSYDTFEPPDGGYYGWFVMIAAFVCNGILFGIINTYSVIYLSLQKQLAGVGDSEASGKAALVGSLTIGTTFLFSVVSGIMVDKLGLRLTTFLGGLLVTSGMLFSSFFTYNIEALYVTYGFMYGLGAAFAYTPTLVILGHYFKRYLGLVSGVVTAGSSVATIVMPKILTYFEENEGLECTFRVLAGIASFVIVCALLYKPLQPPAPPQKEKEGRSALNNCMRSFINFDNWKKKKYLIWTFSIPVALFGYFVPYVHIGKFVEDVFPENDKNLPIMCIGITSGLGRLMFGFIADLPGINRIYLQQSSFVFIGILTMLLPLVNSYTLLLAITLFMGLFDGCFISLLGPIAFDICGSRGATQAIGFLLGLSSLPLTVGPPIAGIMYDHLKGYTVPFVLAGIPPIIGAALMFLILCFKDEENRSDSVINVKDQTHLAQIAWDNENLGANPEKENGKRASLASIDEMELRMEQQPFIESQQTVQ